MEEKVKIQFTFGLECIAYQVIVSGMVIRYEDENGEELVLPEVTESHVIKDV
jgi:hypothetical protein